MPGAAGNDGETLMKPILTLAAAAMISAAALGGMTAPAQAKGCIKGAIVGGIAGHFAHHHGLLGAGAGCLIGHHYSNKNYNNNK